MSVAEMLDRHLSARTISEPARCCNTGRLNTTNLIGGFVMSDDNVVARSAPVKLPPFPASDSVLFAHVPNWPGYAVSDDGDVWSCKMGGEWRKRSAVGSIVILRDEGRSRNASVCTLILESFVGPAPSGCVPTRDAGSLPTDNRLAILRWAPRKKERPAPINLTDNLPAPPKLPPGAEFKAVPGFPGYAASTDGYVWSIRLSGGRIAKHWKRLVGGTQPHGGHKKIILFREDGKPRYVCVHIVILETFVGPCPSGMEGCHDPDRNPANNALSNLRWDTHKGNCADKIRHGTSQRGERSAQSKLTTEQVLQIRAAHASGASQTDLAKQYGVKSVTVNAIVRRRNWRHV